MKKIITITLVIFLGVILAGCQHITDKERLKLEKQSVQACIDLQGVPILDSGASLDHCQFPNDTE